jgi:threonine aldolase
LIADLIADADTGVVDPSAVETNIVVLKVGERAERLVADARAAGVLTGIVGPGLVRLITHLDVSAAAARKAGEILADLVRTS